MPDSQQYQWNRYLINIGEIIVIFLGLKEFISDNSYTYSCSRNEVEKPHLKIISFQNHVHARTNNAFNGTVVNQTLSSLAMEGHLKLRLKGVTGYVR